MIVLDEKTKHKLKQILLENIVSIIVFTVVLVYFLFEGDSVGVVFIMVFLPWFAFSILFFTTLFDWKIFPDLRNWILASFIIGFFGSSLFLYIGLGKVVKLFMLYALTVGLCVTIALRICSLFSKDGE